MHSETVGSMAGVQTTTKKSGHKIMLIIIHFLNHNEHCRRHSKLVLRGCGVHALHDLGTNKTQARAPTGDTRTPDHAYAPDRGRAGSPRRRARRSRRAQKLGASRRHPTCRPQQHRRRPGCHGELAVAGGSLCKRAKSRCNRPPRRQHQTQLLSTAGAGLHGHWAAPTLPATQRALGPNRQ